MCFVTDGKLHHWYGRRAWREWRVSRTGWLLPPIAGWPPISCDRRPNPWRSGFAVCDSHSPPSLSLTHWLETAVGLYAYTSANCWKPYFGPRFATLAYAWGSVRCFGPGYVSNDGTTLTAESMVIERMWAHPRISTKLLAKLRAHYPFVDFRRSTPC